MTLKIDKMMYGMLLSEAFCLIVFVLINALDKVRSHTNIHCAIALAGHYVDAELLFHSDSFPGR